MKTAQCSVSCSQESNRWSSRNCTPHSKLWRRPCYAVCTVHRIFLRWRYTDCWLYVTSKTQ